MKFLALTIILLFVPHAMAQTVLCLGDSLTEGFGVERAAAWPALVENLLQKKHPGIKVINSGISGSTSASGPSRITWHLKSKPVADILVLALGANDGLRGLKPEAMKDNLLKTMTIARNGGIKKIILAGIKVPPNYGQKYANEFESIFPSLAKSEKVVLIPFLLEGVAGKPELNLPDGIHPNAQGHKIVSETVMRYLEKAL
jgi:acyl-CoA thioesterase-1